MTTEEHKTKTQLLQELERLRQRIRELEQAEKLLHESQARYRELVEEMKDVIYTLDTQGNVTFVNEAGKATFGRDLKEVIGKHFGNWIPQRHLPQAMAVFNRILAGETITTETVLLDKQGKPHDVEFSSTPVIRDGKVVGTRGIIRDITERKQIEQKLKDSEQALCSMVNAITESAILVETDGTVVVVNEVAAERLGSTIDEMVGKNIYDFFPNDVVESRRIQVNKVIQTGQPVAFEDIRLGKYIHNSVYPIKDSSGNVTKLAIFALDLAERKKGKHALWASENKYRTLLENLPQKIFLKDKNSVYISCNKNYAADLKIEPEEIAGRTDYDFYPKELAEKYRADDTRIVESGQIKDIEEKYIHNGQEAIVHTVKTPVRDEQGNIVAVLGIFWDITEQKRTEHARKIAEEKRRLYQLMVESAHDAIFLKDLESRYVIANRKALETFGLSYDQVIGKNDYQIMPNKKGARKNIEDDRLVFKMGKPTEITKCMTSKDGQVRWFQAVKVPQFDDRGNIVGLIGIARDVTERRRAEDTLRESEEKYRTLIESAGESICIVDKNGVFRFMNTTAAERLGGKPEDFVGKTMWDLFPKKIADYQAAVIRKVIRMQQGLTDVAPTELQGKRRWYSTTYAPLRNDKGKVTAAMTVARDISSLKRAEDELERYRERMTRAEQLGSLGTLSATLAHELTQPLTIIGLSIENCLPALKKTAAGGLIRQDLRNALDEVSNAASIIDRFRTFARKSTGKSVGKVNLKAVAERIVNLLSKTAHRVRVRLVIRNLDKMPRIYAYETDIEQMFFILAQNAIQAADGKEDRRLTISGASTRQQVELRFTDTCGGIPAENLDRIFQPFFTTKSPSEGVGLGLYIVQEIVSRAGGKIRVKSKLGKGSTFVVSLPIRANKGF